MTNRSKTIGCSFQSYVFLILSFVFFFWPLTTLLFSTIFAIIPLVSFPQRSGYINSAPLACLPRIRKNMGTMGCCMVFEICERKSTTFRGFYRVLASSERWFYRCWSSCSPYLFGCNLLTVSLLERSWYIPVPVVPVVPINFLRLIFFLYYIYYIYN